MKPLLAQNRAEEIGLDVWDHFVIPHFFDILDLEQARKPRVIVGGRGCGKTMLLRYFSHQSAFSARRTHIEESATDNIGLYFKVDTQFANQMSGRGIENDIWESAFYHYLSLTIGAELLKALESIARSHHSGFSVDELARLQFPDLQAFDQEFPLSFPQLETYFRLRKSSFEAWLNNVRTQPAPLFLTGRSFAISLISAIKGQVPCLKNSVFHFYLDEYENLTQDQRRIINTCIKHSEPPFLFHIAMKKNSMEDKRTTGAESINEPDDFRTRDLDDLLHSSSFNIFAGEVLFLRLVLTGTASLPVDPRVLRNPASLDERKTRSYQDAVLNKARGILPGITNKELAKIIFDTPPLIEKVRHDLTQALKARRSKIAIGEFLNPLFPEASLVTPALLYRTSLDPDAVLGEFQKLAAKEENKFNGATGWIHNNLIGSILKTYAPYARTCPFYSGFETFIHLSRGNLRHFLELAYKSIAQSQSVDLTVSIPIEKQAEAAKQVSTSLFDEIRNFGTRGNALRSFVLSLGSLFALAHSRPTQSESEVNHFSVKTGQLPFTDEDHQFFKEAVKWGVLFEESETKEKNRTAAPIEKDLVLNPIYAPYFNISYRKKRKLALSSDEIIVMIRGSYDERATLFQAYRRQWNIDDATLDLPLFNHLND